MAARKRDHKAEYQRRKQLAQAKGYAGVRDYKRTRKQLGLKIRDTAPPKTKAQTLIKRLVSGRTSEIARLRAEARKWSSKHSHGHTSKYRTDMTDAEVRAYHRAYVEYNPDGLSRRKAARDKRRRIGKYVADWHDMEPNEWEQKYTLQGSV